MATQRQIAGLIAQDLIKARRQLMAHEINGVQHSGRIRTIYRDHYAATALLRPMSPETFARVWQMACKMVDLELEGNHLPEPGAVRRCPQ